jgi:hypothetical protein
MRSGLPAVVVAHCLQLHRHARALFGNHCAVNSRHCQQIQLLFRAGALWPQSAWHKLCGVLNPESKEVCCDRHLRLLAGAKSLLVGFSPQLILF